MRALLLIVLLLLPLGAHAETESRRDLETEGTSEEETEESREESEEAEQEPKLSPAEQAFLDDLLRLTRAPHRLAGSDAGVSAGKYIRRRLREIGIQEVYPQEIPVWQTRTERCEVKVGTTIAPLYSLRPNVVVNPTTPHRGISGKLIYARQGQLESYGKREVLGGIVVLDYESYDQHQRAFALGANAVIFLGKGDETPIEPKSAAVPSNQVRLYAPETTLQAVDLRQDGALATVNCQVLWERKRGTNWVARIPGSDAQFAPGRPEPEALVLAVDYDTFGAVPELSAGARRAANVAALLEAAAGLVRKPAKRDILLMFLDGQRRGQQGAREVYSTLSMTEDEANQLVRGLEAEDRHVHGMRSLLQKSGLSLGVGGESGGAAVWLKRALADEAEFARDDVSRKLAVVRLSGGRSLATEGPRLEADGLKWDQLRRALHEDSLGEFVADERDKAERGDGSAQRLMEIFQELEKRTLRRLDARRRELEEELTSARQSVALRMGTHMHSGDKTWVVLHASYDFGDQGATWGIVVGDWSNRLFPLSTPKPESDTPGYYGRVLNAMSEASGGLELPRLDERTLGEPTLGLTFAPQPFVASGAIAGAHGLYNVSLMTGYDGRARDGHPADTVARLNWLRLRLQALEGTTLLRALADSPTLSLPGVFKGVAVSEYPTFKAGESSGNYAGLVVSGSLAEDRPAAGALMALWPGKVDQVRNAWTSLAEARSIADYDAIALEAVNQNGRFRLVSLREDIHEDLMTIGALFNESGAVRAISTTERQAQKINEAMRVNLFSGRGGQFSVVHPLEAKPESFKLLKAGLDAEFRDTRALWGEEDGDGFFYVSDQVVDYRVKLFQPLGPVALAEAGKPRGPTQGFDPKDFTRGIWLSEISASDLWELNEARLSTLRERGVTSADLETLHARARRAWESASKSGTTLEREAALSQSAALSQRVYAPLRSAMDDLVHAIVILLLLSIPFAFAMERLLVGATTVYGKIVGFTAAFLVNFALLYWLHPGFAIATTPMIIFLAFAIVLLSALVIYIVVRKFKTELRAMQGQGAGAHDLEVSRAGTLLAAVSMGMSTMRRRPTRTVLTAVTVVMLTFTILSFASFSRTVGVRSVYAGPSNEGTAPDLLVRKLDYSKLPRGLFDLLRGMEGEGGLIAPQYWLVRKEATDPRLSVARLDDGRSLDVDAIMGVSESELNAWPELARSLGRRGKELELAHDAVYLPAIMAQVLKLQVGDRVLLAGHEARYAGSLDGPELQRIRHLDGQSLLPVDFQDAAAQASGGTAEQAEQDNLMSANMAERDFVHLSSDQVAIGSSQLVRSLGGHVHSVSVYTGAGVDSVEQGRRTAEMVQMPVWAAGASGVERLVMTILTEVSGGFALFVPLLLGGLIIFGTLLSSISDREKEIYTFSALGLSPGHVGVLFFAEAAVYAVVGGMGGHLVAQFVALGAAELAEAGLLGPTSINYSSTNSLFAIGVVMLTVLVSAIYPAIRASKSANPGLARTWKMPPAENDHLNLKFPFTVSAYDVTGIVSFLSEHLERHDDAGLGSFAASNVDVLRTERGHLQVVADLALSPFDLGVTQHLTLTAEPSEIPGVDEVRIVVERKSGARSDWYRQNGVFMRDLRRQFLLWRTLSAEVIEVYRLRTLERLSDTELGQTPSGSKEEIELNSKGAS